ncbi:hypothetical protein RhiirC2_850627 [Rhizophagus irregularis]|uniref:Kelch-like protein 17 n=1 Tax=Rhizophagus irregularis TaxID=588596 RepID=A0A2N1N6L1_9GLOM|nr:hypothetical protein RhiirC2_850627 [Rhizophagus irregularis]
MEMTVDLTSSLFRDIESLYKRIEIIDNDEDCDVTLKVKRNYFKAHSFLLKARSEYLRNLIENDRLQSIFRRNITIEIYNMSPDIFKTCLNYIYTGDISLKEYDDNESIFDLVIGANILSLIDMVDYLQNYLIKKKSFWIEQNLIRIYQTSLKIQNFKILTSYCENLIKQEPLLLFESENLTTLEKRNLINIIKWEDLPIKEIKIWRGLVKWIIGQKPSMNVVTNNWNDSDFKEFERRGKDFIPHIRFFCITSDEYSDDVRTFRKILPKNLIEKLEVFYLKKTPPPYDALPPRKFVDTILIDKIQIKHILHWIYGYNEFNENNILKSKIDFKLLARGSRDGMGRAAFHSLCDNKGPTLVIATIDKTNDIIGGFNPSPWTSSNQWIVTSESFIFSFKSKDENNNDIILSRITNPSAAIWDGDNGYDIGFSSDLQLFSGEYNQKNYKNRILDYEIFKITDYEVFQVDKNI